MMNSFSDKTPPPFDAKRDDYTKWSKKFRLWNTITEVEQRKRGALLLFHLDEHTQDRIGELISEEDIVKPNGADAILGHLKTMFGKADEVITVELYEQFESFKRPTDMSIAEYCDQFDTRLKRLQAKGTQLPEPVLISKLLKSANLSEFDEMLVRATVEEQITQEKVQEQKKKE